MPHSVDRFLTTHTGSLPRPDDLIQMMYAKEEGKPVDVDAWLSASAARLARSSASSERLASTSSMTEEMSKPSYATYVKDRLAGFGGAGNSFVYQDLAEFPNMAKRVFGDPGRSRRKTPACNAPITVADPDAVRRDVDNLRSAVGEETAQRPFMTAASPGVISLFFHNDYYPSDSAYLEAISDAMRPEYEAIVAAGFDLQIDCPDLAMGRHIQYANLELSEFRKRAAEHVEALNGALANIPAERVRMHLCWGNYEGPHHCDVPLADIVDIVLSARPAAVSLEAANPRHAHEYAVFESKKLPQGKVLIPGVIESKSNFIEHPEVIANRIGNYAKLVGRENVICRQRLRLRHLGRSGGGRSRHRVGEARRLERRGPHRQRALLGLVRRRELPRPFR